MSELKRLMDAVRDRVNTTRTAPKSAAFGTAAKLALNAEMIESLNLKDARPHTVVQSIDCGHGMMDLYADTTLSADAMELRDEPCGASCL